MRSVMPVPARSTRAPSQRLRAGKEWEKKQRGRYLSSPPVRPVYAVQFNKNQGEARARRCGAAGARPCPKVQRVVRGVPSAALACACVRARAFAGARVVEGGEMKARVFL